MWFAMLGAFQMLGSSMKDTGTAVITMKDCNAEIPPEPIEISAIATIPIIKPQNERITALGSVEPVITTLMVYVIESPVVTINVVVRIKNNTEITIGKGSSEVIASRTAGKLKPSNADEIKPGFSSSNAKPLPPTMLNQKQVIKGAAMLIDRIN